MDNRHDDLREEIESSKLDFNQTAEKEQNIAVMFTDISDFTKLSEGLEPKEVLELLSEYQTKMVAAVLLVYLQKYYLKWTTKPFGQWL